MGNLKLERAYKAQAWNKKMEEEHQKLIQSSISKTIIYDEFDHLFYPISNNQSLVIEVVDLDTVSAIMQYQDSSKMAALSFASYKNPGGGFLKGSLTQEEALCQKSFLYNVLNHFYQDYYVENRQNLNYSLYKNRALYSPNIYFYFNDQIGLCDIITCSAPNFSAARKHPQVDLQTNEEELLSRIKFILDIASTNKIETLILGAFGCGVFGQNPTKVAEMMKNLLRQKYPFKKMIFAIPKSKHNKNYEAFKKVFE